MRTLRASSSNLTDTLVTNSSFTRGYKRSIWPLRVLRFCVLGRPAWRFFWVGCSAFFFAYSGVSANFKDIVLVFKLLRRSVLQFFMKYRILTFCPVMWLTGWIFLGRIFARTAFFGWKHCPENIFGSNNIDIGFFSIKDLDNFKFCTQVKRRLWFFCGNMYNKSMLKIYGRASWHHSRIWIVNIGIPPTPCRLDIQHPMIMACTRRCRKYHFWACCKTKYTGSYNSLRFPLYKEHLSTPILLTAHYVAHLLCKTASVQFRHMFIYWLKRKGGFYVDSPD